MDKRALGLNGPRGKSHKNMVLWGHPFPYSGTNSHSLPSSGLYSPEVSPKMGWVWRVGRPNDPDLTERLTLLLTIFSHIWEMN